MVLKEKRMQTLGQGRDTVALSEKERKVWKRLDSWFRNRVYAGADRTRRVRRANNLSLYLVLPIPSIKETRKRSDYRSICAEAETNP